MPPWRFTMEDYAAQFHPRLRELSPDMTPGGWKAKQQGCTCSRLDNNNGYGSVYAEGPDVEFLVMPNCPIHNGEQSAPTGD